MEHSGSTPVAACRIHPRDDVAVVLADTPAGALIVANDGTRIVAGSEIPRGHKVALASLPCGAEIFKYGSIIGRARCAIAPGEHVHSANLETRLAGLAEFNYEPVPLPAIAPTGAPAFRGYCRSDGRVGTRNELWIIATVGCVARLSQRLAAAGQQRFAGRVDGVHALTHPFGCSQTGRDLDNTRRILASLAAHPNAGGVLIVGLGCESNQARELLRGIQRSDLSRVRVLAAQADGDEFEHGMELLDELCTLAERDARQDCGADALCIGVKCGGSDGMSGLTANPLVGRIAEQVVAHGGRVILTEIPEAFGAEHLLLQRVVSREVFDETATIFQDFRRYFARHGEPIHENPSPGNIAGGITTLEEKSLGAVQKGGRAPITSALRYGERVSIPGLAVLEAPGNDAVSSTALVAAGANVILFTTGRGTPLGFPVPTLKIASNAELALRKPAWIDFDASVVLGGSGFDAATAQLRDLVCATASGQQARNEINGEREMAIWKTGVTL